MPGKPTRRLPPSTWPTPSAYPGVRIWLTAAPPGPRLVVKSEDEDMVGGQRPLAEHLHAAGLGALDGFLRPDPAGLGAGPSSSDFAAPGERGHHPLDVVVTARGLLAGDGALHPVAEEEYTDADLRVLDEVQRQPHGIVRPLVPIRPVVDNNQILLHRSVGRGSRSLSGFASGGLSYFRPCLQMLQQHLPHQIAGFEDLGIRQLVIQIRLTDLDGGSQFGHRFLTISQAVDDFESLGIAKHLADAGVQFV